MLVSTMNIEALIKARAEQGIHLCLTCVPLAAGGYAAELSPIAEMNPREKVERVAASGSKLNWALINLDAVCERALFEMKGKRKAQP